MNSALSLILGVSVLATVVGCGGGSSDATGGSGPIAVSGSGTGGASTSAGTSSMGGSGQPAGGTANLPEGVPLTPTDGWVDIKSNTLGIQGAVFSYADDTSKMGMTGDFTGMNACIKGTAAKVDTKCTPPAGMDCFGVTFGAAMGLNLNQPTTTDASGMSMGGMPMPFDASALTGFAFEITGGADATMLPAPASLRFLVTDGSSVDYCTPTTKGVKAGVNTYLFSDLVTKCWTTGGVPATGAKSGLLKIAWQVVTNATGPIPFDFCVKNIRALQ